MGAIPIHLVTGFLGSGKTTFLRRALADPAFADAAVIVNEIGEIGLDHHLVERIDGDVVLLKSGCICCTVRSDLADTMRDLIARAGAGGIPPFTRLLIETTGLADPVPILATILHERVVRHQFRLGAILTTVDAVNGDRHLDRQAESVKQVAIADRILLTKTDLAEAAAVAALESRLRRINPGAACFRAPDPFLSPVALLADALDPATRSPDVANWFLAPSSPRRRRSLDLACHDASIETFTLTVDEPIDWTIFALWLSLLLDAHGEDILRVKGLLHVAETATPVIVHGVQHLVHAPSHLVRWPSGDRRTRLVFITRGIRRAAVERSFAIFREAMRKRIPATAGG